MYYFNWLQKSIEGDICTKPSRWWSHRAHFEGAVVIDTSRYWHIKTLHR